MHVPYQEIISIHDSENVLTGSARNYLSIEVSHSAIAFCVLDTEKFRYTVLESFKLHEEIKDPLQLANMLEFFVKDKKILTGFYQRISFSYISRAVTFVPAQVFSYLQKRLFIDFNVYPDDTYEIKVDKLNNLGAYSVYPVSKPLLSKINFLFPGCRIRHHSGCLIENILYLSRYSNQHFRLVLHVQHDHFEILLIENDTLQFYNSFSYQTYDDLFYYLFFVLEQLGLQAEDLDALLFGEVSIDSMFYKNLRLYVKSLRLGPRSDLFKYCDQMDDIPHHYYFNLLNLNSCG